MGPPAVPPKLFRMDLGLGWPTGRKKGFAIMALLKVYRERRPVQLIGAALDLYVDRRAARKTLGGIVAVRCHINDLHGFETRNIRRDLLQPCAFHGSAIDGHHVAAAFGAVGHVGKGPRRVGGHRVGVDRRGNAGHGDQQVLKVAAGRQVGAIPKGSAADSARTSPPSVCKCRGFAGDLAGLSATVPT